MCKVLAGPLWASYQSLFRRQQIRQTQLAWKTHLAFICPNYIWLPEEIEEVRLKLHHRQLALDLLRATIYSSGEEPAQLDSIFRNFEQLN